MWPGAAGRTRRPPPALWTTQLRLNPAVITCLTFDQDMSFIVKNNRKGPDGKHSDLALVNKWVGLDVLGRRAGRVGAAGRVGQLCSGGKKVAAVAGKGPGGTQVYDESA